MLIKNITCVLFLFWALSVSLQGAEPLKMNVFIEEPIDTPINQEHVVRRAGFDCGGGSIRGLVADVDLSTNTIVRKLFNGKISIPFRESLKHQNELSPEIEAIATQALSELIDKMAQYQPTAYRGIATEAFRLATNGKQFLERVSSHHQVPITIIDQELEGVLGFKSTAMNSTAPTEETVVIDMGTGSMQITAMRADLTFEVFKAKLGRIALDEILLGQIRKTEATAKINPVSQEEALLLDEAIAKELHTMNDFLKEKMVSGNTKVIGSFDTGVSIHLWQRAHIWTILTDHFLNKIAAEPKTSKAILIYSILKHLNVQEITLTDTDTCLGSTPGLLISEAFWNQ